MISVAKTVFPAGYLFDRNAILCQEKNNTGCLAPGMLSGVHCSPLVWQYSQLWLYISYICLPGEGVNAVTFSDKSLGVDKDELAGLFGGGGLSGQEPLGMTSRNFWSDCVTKGILPVPDKHCGWDCPR